MKQQIVEIAMNASGIRDTARVLHVSPATVIKELKKETDLQPVHHAVLAHLNPEQAEVEICRADEFEQRSGLSSELDEREGRGARTVLRRRKFDVQKDIARAERAHN
jgi:hypothetical protein